MAKVKKARKGWLTNHAKSSAAMISLGIHAVLILVAATFVAVKVIQKEDPTFEAKPVNRPKQQLKKLQVPVKMNKSKPKPKLRKRVVVKDIKRKPPEFKMPEISGVKTGIGNLGDGAGGMESIGFSMPEMDFFGAKAKGEKVVFVVHFGPATIGKNPFTRTTGLTIRNRLADLVDRMPEYTLFNVTAYWANDNWAMSPEMMLATPDNKQKVKDWMKTVNPLVGDYDHCFSIGKESDRRIEQAYGKYPTRVENISNHSTTWAYPYRFPKDTGAKYLGEGKNFVHWNWGVAWAILEQKPDTIFVLTTNYIDAWGGGEKGESGKLTSGLKKLCTDVYGPDQKKWPTINVVVLANAGRDSSRASTVLSSQFGPVISAFKGDGSVIDDITKFMTDDEEELYRKYRSEYGNQGKNN